MTEHRPGRTLLRGAHAAARRAVASKGSHTEVRCRRDGRTLEFAVPSNEMWVCVKDDLILREYEWLGVDLQSTTGTVVDCGAHVGTFTAMAALYARRVVALEPAPATSALLRANMERNGLDNVEVVEAALWTDDNGVRLNGQPVSSASSVVRGADTAVETFQVATLPLEALAERYGPIDLLKLDIEGAEFDVLGRASDAALRSVTTYVGEIHSFLGSSAAIVARLRDAGFDVTLTRGPFFHARESLRQLGRTWRTVEGQWRLKGTVALLYAGAGALDRLVPIRERLQPIDIEFVIARRTGR